MHHQELKGSSFRMNRQFDLAPHGILRPEKISWFFPAHTKDIVSELKSKSLRSFVSKSAQLLAEAGLKQEIKLMTQEDFLKWLPYYTEKMTNQSYEVLASPEWFTTKTEKGRDVYSIFITRQDTLVASLIFTYAPESQRSSIAFRANDRLDIFSGGRSSIGSLLDYAFLQWSLQYPCLVVSAGRSRNAFGVTISVGNLDFKR